MNKHWMVRFHIYTVVQKFVTFFLFHCCFYKRWPFL